MNVALRGDAGRGDALRGVAPRGGVYLTSSLALVNITYDSSMGAGVVRRQRGL